MSVSYYGYLIAGVLIKDVIREHNEASTRTKYNEHTGEPYQVETIIAQKFIGEVDVSPEGGASKDFALDEDLLEEYELEVFGSSPEKGSEAIGIGIAGVDEDSPIQKLSDVEEKLQEAREKLAEIGVDHPVSLILIQYVSY